MADVKGVCLFCALFSSPSLLPSAGVDIPAPGYDDVPTREVVPLMFFLMGAVCGESGLEPSIVKSSCARHGHAMAVLEKEASALAAEVFGS